jgi:flagellar hook capping protein FlgD
MLSRPDGHRLTRAIVALVVTALLGGTAAALALTEQLKLERSPVLRTHVGKLLGPRCRCALRRIEIAFVLRKPERLTVAVVDADDQVVRTLVSSSPRRRGLQRFSWDGRDEAGQVVSAGTYRPRLHLAREHRTILMPNPIRVDPTAPRISLVSLRPRRFSPDGDLRRDVVYIRYRASERARALLYVDGILRVELRRYAQSGLVRWRGTVFGRPLAAGRHRLALRALDLAGNRSARIGLGFVGIRYIGVRPHVRRALPGARVAFRVTTDAKRYRWRLGNGGGRARTRRLLLRAPAVPGRYRLVVTANGHSARALLLVVAGA